MAKAYVIDGAAERALRRLVKGNAASAGGTFAPGTISFDEFAQPYAVRWASSADSGSGAWIIWFPANTLLMVNGASVSPLEHMEAAGAPYPTGWYVVDALTGIGGDLYLNVTIDYDGTVSAAFASTTATPTAGQNAVSVHICNALRTPATGKVAIKQYVTSALTFVFPAKPTDAPFDFEEYSDEHSQLIRQLVRCKFYFDGQLEELNDYTTPAGNSTIYLTGTKGETATAWDFALAAAPATAPQGGRVLNIKLYDLEDGRPKTDYRSTFLTLSEPLEFNKKELKVNNTRVAYFYASDDVNITTGGGGGGTTGYTGSIEVVTDIWYDLSEHKLLKKTRNLTYADGVLTAAGNESTENVTNGDAVPVSGLVSGNS